MLTISDINESNPILILYSSGTGGEFLTNIIAANSNSINPVLSETNTERNLTNTTCIIDYATMWSDPDNSSTWQCKLMSDQYTQLIGNGSYIIKDHPSLYFAKYYWKFLPNLKVLHLVVKQEYSYFAKLTFAKLLNRVNVQDVTFEYIKRTVNNTNDSNTLNTIKNWAEKYTWIWEHELHIVNTQYKSRQPVTITHNDDIYHYVTTQGDAIAYESNVLPKYLSMIYDNYQTIPVDCLVTDSTEFWNTILPYINNLDIKHCIRNTNKWIENNTSIMERRFLNEYK